MTYKFFLAFLLLASLSRSQVVGTCQKYSDDGLSCQTCVQNHHLYQGSCYINILGCKQYNFGNICHQCQNNYILVNNLCCDSVCMQKIFSKFNQQVIKETILNNTQILKQLIPFIQATYIKNSTARLVALQAKDYLHVRRFALLYQFYQVQQYSSKRLIIDYQTDNQKFIPVDWTQVNDSPAYATILWNQIKDKNQILSILALFPSLYSVQPLSVQVKKAVLSEINQYSIVSQDQNLLNSRNLYLYQQEIVLLQQSTQQNLIQTNNQSNQTTIPINVQNQTQQPSNQQSITFVPYTNTYSGDQIKSQQLINQPLNQSILLVQSLPGFNYTLTIVKQSSQVFGIINFIIIGENKYVIIRYVISYSNLTKTPLLTDQIQQPKAQQNTTEIPQNQSGSYTIQDGDQKNIIYYQDSIPKNLSSIINQTENIVNITANSSPSSNLNQLANPVFRRMIVTTPINGAIMLEVALVYSNPAVNPYAQTFYYWIFDTQNASYIYAGALSKVQTSQIYSNPLAYSLSFSDPSIYNYPFSQGFGNYFNNQTINSNLLQSLKKNGKYQEQIWNQKLIQTQKDRNLIRYKRLKINFGNSSAGMMVVAYYDTLGNNITWMQQIQYNTTTVEVQSNPSNSTQPSSTSQTILISSQVYVIKQGNIVHTFYPNPIPQEMSNLMNQLTAIPKTPNQYSNTSLVNTQPTSNSFRRMVLTTALQNTLKYQIALVYSKSQINQYAEVFYYYIVDSKDNSAIFCGSLLKIQTLDVYSNPWAYKLQQSDPSIFSYPFSSINGNYLSQQIINTALLSVLNAKTQYPQNLWATPILSTQNDRFLINYKRIRIDFGDSVNKISVLAIYDNINHLIFFDQQTPYYNMTNRTTEGTTQTSISTDITGSTTVITNDISNLLNEDQILQSILEYVQQKEPIVSSYTVSTVQISEYELTLEYQILYVGSDGSSIHATVVHTKQSHQNNLINFQITQVESTQSTQPSNITKIQNGYIQNPTISGNVTTGNNSNPDNTSVVLNNDNSSNITKSAPLLTQQERIQQIIDYVLQKLVMNYDFIDPKVNQILSNVDNSSGTVKINLIIQNKTDPIQDYSVMVIGKLQSQSDPIIQQVKPISPQIANTLNQINPTPSDSTSQSQNSNISQETCNMTVNNNGQQVCQNEGSSGEVDVTPSANLTTQTSTNPSDQAVSMLQEQSIQQSQTTSDGQVIKTSINPKNNSIQNNTEQILNLIQNNYQQEMQASQNNSIYTMKVLMIQVAATTVTIQYAIIVKFCFQNVYVLKRYFYVKSVDTNELYFMGIQDLASNFDVFLPENRYFNVLQTLEQSQQTSQVYQGIINTTKIQQNIDLNLSDIQSVKYRIYPYGYYLNAYVSTSQLIGVSHIIQIQNRYIMIKWNQQAKQQTPIQTNTTPSSNNNLNSSTQSQTSNYNTTTTNLVNSSNLTNNQTNSTNPENSLNNSTNPSNSSNIQDNTVPTNTNTTGNSESQMQAQQQINSSQLVLDQTLEDKLLQVLNYLSQNKPELANSTLQQYATTQSTNSVQFDLYFVKFISDTLVVQYITSCTRNEQDGSIKIILFQSNEIDLGQTDPNIQMSSNTTHLSNQTNLTNENTSSTNQSSFINNSNTSTQTQNSSTTQTTDKANESTGYFPVDPNQIYYSQAITLVNQDPRNSTDVIIDLSNINSTIDQIIRYIRVNYLIILQSGVLKIVNAASNSSLISKYVIYFYKESTPTTPYYRIYKVIINRNLTTKQTKFDVENFILYASNHQILTNSTGAIVQDQTASNSQDTDIAYGYRTVDSTTISQDSNIQNVIAYIQLKYGSIVANKTIFKVQQLQLSDGRMNYKIIFSKNNSTQVSDQFKFVAFYQPSLDKVLVLNTINLPQNSQYNQLSNQQLKSDTLLTSVIAYVNSLHSQDFGNLNTFTVKSVSKKISSSSSIQYQLILTSQSSNKKFRSFVRVAANQIDMKQISFGQIVEVSLDHYRLDQFDQMFIMNYQKLDYDQLHTSSNFRMVLAYLYNTKPTLNNSSILGAAFKPYGLGFLYKLYFTLSNSNIISTEVYIESYSDKISLKSYVNADFVTNFNSISAINPLVQQIILLIKSQQQNSQLDAVSGVSSKDFLYGTLYKLQFTQSNITKQFLVYHDHSTEQINIVLSRQVSSTGTIFDIQNCAEYNSLSPYLQCLVCNQGSELLNRNCILLSNCGGLCQKITL